MLLNTVGWARSRDAGHELCMLLRGGEVTGGLTLRLPFPAVLWAGRQVVVVCSRLHARRHRPGEPAALGLLDSHVHQCRHSWEISV